MTGLNCSKCIHYDVCGARDIVKPIWHISVNNLAKICNEYKEGE